VIVLDALPSFLASSWGSEIKNLPPRILEITGDLAKCGVFLLERFLEICVSNESTRFTQFLD